MKWKRQAIATAKKSADAICANENYSMFALLERGMAGKDTMWYQGEE
jgi:hypothetical protein